GPVEAIALPGSPMTEVTRLLSAIEQGDPSAADQLLPLVYEELRQLAAQKLAQERPGQTLQATALVHEAYLRLVDVEQAPHWNSRGHFFAAAAEAMRRILVDTKEPFPLRRPGSGCGATYSTVPFIPPNSERFGVRKWVPAVRTPDGRGPSPRPGLPCRLLPLQLSPLQTPHAPPRPAAAPGRRRGLALPPEASPLLLAGQRVGCRQPCLHIACGPHGLGGEGTNGPAEEIGKGKLKVTVPARLWK